ncbi:hypothetical protein FHW12_002772 [Dokdonella fugitiva]|uniref:Fibronectin type-III domain-containing protein n=1 Tax=Dokdonella fugitiva TaxID=328517 RepID=A0A839F3Z6_9GAMM|nr:hypothetical protein [Dokdonella fugitiva]MBA8888539.1 hypothetical protein [Dokdonella fugitiva]
MVLSRFLPAALGAAVCAAFGASAAPVTVTKPTASAPEILPTVMHAARADISAPLRDILRTMPPASPMGTEQEPFEVPNVLLKPTARTSSFVPDYSRMQTRGSGVPAPTIDLTFEAISSTTSGCGCLPPDTNGDVSDTHFIQWVNSSWQAFDKVTGVPDPNTLTPRPGNSFFTGFGGKCETTNSGDPLAIWDPRAQRWVMSQFVTSSPFAQCVAVSTTSDPFGTYARYEFNWPNFGDYPHMGIWTDGAGQDAYVLTTHEFNASNAFQGASLIALERDKMLAGDPTAAMVRFPGFDAYGVEPVNLTGSLNAPTNACPSFVHFDSVSSEYLFWDLCLNWTTPASSTISSTPTRVQGAPFVPFFDEVPQQGSGAGLDPFGTHIMYRANARAFPADAPTRISLVVNHVVQGNVQQGGINWVHFDLDDHGANPPTPTPLDRHIVDEGVYAPDSNTRWMGGISIDGSGNIGVGFSKSSSAIHPQIEISGRTLDDPAGTLRDETNCTDTIANGSQTSTSNRWGDYSAMTVDPVDQCTFYFTTEYYPLTAGASWHTRVCSFKFDNCGDPNYALVAETPKRVEMCEATTTGDPTYGLRVGVLNGFNSAVTLAGNGLPAGATAQFSANPVTAPGSSTLTLVGGSTLPSGEYVFGVDATSGSLTRSIALELGVSANAPTPVTLILPTDTASGVKVRPLLSWGTIDSTDRIFADGLDGVAPPPVVVPSDALEYLVEVATDSAFSNIVASATVTGTTWTVDTTLNSTTTYYWRVTPSNYCGPSAPSATFSFTTGTPGTCPGGTTSTTVYQENFDAGAGGWTAAGTGGTGWTQGAAPAGTGFTTPVWKVPDNTVSSDRTLTSPSIVLPAGAQAIILSYDAYHKSEQDPPGGCWDSSSLEASTNGTTFDYLDASRMFTDPYNGVASAGAPLAGRQGWCYPGPAGTAAPSHAIVDLDSFAGQSVNLRFRMVSDSNTAAGAPNGLAIDNVKVEACQ